MLSSSNKNALSDVAGTLGVPSKKLFNLINFESSFDPAAINPYSKAMGLIQFTNTTAKSMGFKNAADLVRQYPSINSQLYGPVLSYLKKFAPFKSDQSLYMSVFYPAARSWLPYKLFPSNVRSNNPGINNPADYVRKVNQSSGLTSSFPLIILLGIGIAIYNYLKPKTKGEKYVATKSEVAD